MKEYGVYTLKRSKSTITSLDTPTLYHSLSILSENMGVQYFVVYSYSDPSVYESFVNPFKPMGCAVSEHRCEEGWWGGLGGWFAVRQCEVVRYSLGQLLLESGSFLADKWHRGA